MSFIPDKTRFKDERGRYIVQGLFLEDRYNTTLSVYTFDGEDKDYKGTIFPSLKRLYLQHRDPLEYSFANLYLYDWDHWQRLCRNRLVSAHIEKWREELRLSLVSDGVGSIIDQALNKDSYQAAKWLAEMGWDKSGRGRPSKEEVEGELKKRADQEKNWSEDFQLLHMHKEKTNG